MRIYIHVHWIIQHMTQIKDFQINISGVHFSKNRIKTLEATHRFFLLNILGREKKTSNLFRTEIDDRFNFSL